MESFIVIFLICLALGGLVGFLAGLLGIGGGLIMVPVLVYLFTDMLQMGLSQAMPMAIATSLFTIILTGVSASFAHYKLSNISRRVALWSGLGIAFGAIFGAQLASHISGQLLKTIFASLVLAIVAYMLLGKRKMSQNEATKTKLTGVGVVTGFLSALMGIGGGSIMVPALIWYRVDIKRAIGCASFCGLIIAIFGSASFVQAGWNNTLLPEYSFGYIYLPAGIGIVITSVFTAGVGAKLSQSLNTDMLKKIFAGFLVLVSLRMLFS